LESTYRVCLCHELTCRGIRFATEVPVPVRYRDVFLDCGYRPDVVVELKSVEALQYIHYAQILTYLKLSGMRTGLVINFKRPGVTKWNQTARPARGNSPVLQLSLWEFRSVMQQAVEVIAFPLAGAIEAFELRFLRQELGRVEDATAADERDVVHLVQ